MHEYDNRYLWMNLKRIISSHFANYKEAWEANRLIDKGLIHPTLSKVYPMEEVGQAADRKSTRLNSSRANISYAVFCLKKKKTLNLSRRRPSSRTSCPFTSPTPTPTPS